ncbi:MAG: ribonuclease BN (tRNA processing enzyme) [Candidatus Paceibacteria bacterium]|jgi:ribonuclease BN (tRNA processing enzyme)
MKISQKPDLSSALSNDGDLSLFFIGTGSAFAKTLNQNNLLVVKGEQHLLVDCGTRCSQALHEYQLPISKIRNFVITHSHADHIGGLEEVHMHGRYVSKSKPNMIINEEYQAILWEQSLRGGSEMSEAMPLAFTDLWHCTRPVKMPNQDRETWETSLGTINIKLPRTMHYPDTATSWRDSFWSCGVIFDDRVLYTSDTRFDPAMISELDSIYNFEVIFHDCQLFTGGVHASLDELSTLPPAIKAKTILMHYGDSWRDSQQQGLDAGFHSWAQQGSEYVFPG